MKRMHSISSIAAAIALACAAPFALAQTTPESQHPQTGAMTHTPPYQTTPSNPANQQLPPVAFRSVTNECRNEWNETVLIARSTARPAPLAFLFSRGWTKPHGARISS